MNKVQIIDDDKELCALIKRSVLSEDIEADFCNTGKEGLQKLKEKEYQLVILDVMMPGMDGFETLSMRFSLQSTCTRLSEIPHFFAASGQDIYSITPKSFLQIISV